MNVLSPKLASTFPICMHYLLIDTHCFLVQVHNNVMRDLIRSMGGYEVKTEGDAFMVAFRDVVMAVEWALSAQVSAFCHKEREY